MNIKSSLFLLTPILILAHPFESKANDSFRSTESAIETTPSATHTKDSPLKLDISGHIKMYGNYADQDGKVKAFDILRDTDVTFSGETTLSNGITIGAVINTDGDGGDSFDIEDSFIFAENDYGRLSAGVEDGSVFMLQVAAPSADDNVDGLEPFVSPINYSATTLSGTDFEDTVSSSILGYANFLTAGVDKVTYISPVLSGLQGGVSYTPDVANFSPASSGSNGNATTDVLDEFGSAWEAALRYENSPSEMLNYRLGAGYTSIGVERTNAASTVDTFTEWNLGLDFDIGSFGIGAVYTENNGGVVANNDSKTYVLGVDYTIDNIKYGASWLNNTHEESATEEIEANRLAAGLVYEYGPGLSFRGSVSHVAVDAPSTLGGDVDGTSVTIGTQILF
jgi:outer membrane protein OmpU